MKILTVTMTTALLILTACEDREGRGFDFNGPESADFAVRNAQTTALLRVANEADQATLDGSVGLDARAAFHIVQAREKDGHFTTVAQLDAVSYVGEGALENMAKWAEAQGLVGCADCTVGHAALAPEGIINGIAERSYAAGAILAAASDASQDELDDAVGLDARAAAAILADRAQFGDYRSLTRLDGVAWVNQRAFDQLLTFARARGLEPFCGDGLVQPGVEVCDGGEGCRKDCK